MKWDKRSKLCGNCDFWPLFPVQDCDRPIGRYGFMASECRRHAPIAIRPSGTHGQWPMTEPEEYCGDFRPRTKRSKG